MWKAIFFDAAGTLIYLPQTVGVHYREVGLRHDFDLDAVALDKAFKAVWKAMPARPSIRTARPCDDRLWWRELVFRVLDQVDAPDYRRDLYFDDLYEHFRNPFVWAVYPEVTATVVRLARKYRLAIVSNFDGRLRNVLAGHGLLKFFDHIVISSEIGADKPDQAIFYEAIKRMGVPAHQTLHVGDDPQRDWAGAEAVGITAFRLKRPKVTLKELEEFVAQPPLRLVVE